MIQHLEAPSTSVIYDTDYRTIGSGEATKPAPPFTTLGGGINMWPLHPLRSYLPTWAETLLGLGVGRL